MWRAAALGGGAPSPPRDGEGAATTATKPLILIVDDDYDFLEINRMMLERAGYRVAVAAEPQQALRKMAEEQPDLVITDLMMASLDSGFSFARTIKEDLVYGDIPVIIASSVSSSMGLDFRPRTADETAQMKVDAYFDKPLAPDKLLAKIEELLTARRVRAAGAAASPPDTPDPVNRAPVRGDAAAAGAEAG